MKKLGIGLLGAVLLASTTFGTNGVSASGTQSPAAAKKGKITITGCTAKGTISFMFWGDKGDKAAQDASVKLAEKDCPGLHVNEIWDSGNYDTDLATKIGSGNAPDLFQLDGSKRIPEYVAQGALAPIDSFIKKDKLNMSKTFWPMCAQEMAYKGKTYGLPRTCSNQSLLFYNKEMFKARGVKAPTNNWTYQDLANAGAKLSGTYSVPHDATSQLRFGIAQNTDDFRTEQFMWAWGGDWLNSKLNQCTLTSKQSRTGLQFLHDLSYKYHAMPTSAQASGLPDYFSGFQKERYAMAFMGPWALDYAFGKTPGGTPLINFNWGVVLTPKGPSSRQAVMAATAEVVSASSKHKNAAYWLARFVTEGPGAIDVGKYGVDTPGAKALWNAKPVVTEFGKTVLQVARDGNKTGRYPKLVPQYDKFWNTINGDLSPLWKDAATVQQVTTQACSDVTSQGLMH
jgi:ABC-type glycerol-3-phosphate transport system substrate-binding protein